MTIPDAVIIQFFLLKMGMLMLETCRGLPCNIHKSALIRHTVWGVQYIVVVVVVVAVVYVLPSHLCRVFTIIYLKQTMFVGHIVLQLFCIYSLW